MRALKALVIGMAVLIFAGIVVLIVGIIDKAGKTGGDAPSAGVHAPAPATAAFGMSEIDLPAGAAVRETRLDGNRILVRLEMADGSQRIVLIDAATGKRTGTIVLK